MDKYLKPILIGILLGLFLKATWDRGLIQELLQLILDNRGPVLVIIIIIGLVILIIGTSPKAGKTIALDLKTIVALALSLSLSLSFAFNPSLYLNFVPGDWIVRIGNLFRLPRFFRPAPASNAAPAPTPFGGPFPRDTWPFYDTPFPTAPPTDTPTPTPTTPATATPTPTPPPGFNASTPTSPANVTPAAVPTL